MQGWRKTMEDAHISVHSFYNGYGLYGVMDGHGGPEVAMYSKDNLPNFIKNNPLLKSKQWKELFTSSICDFDQTFLTEGVQKELIEYLKKSKSEERYMQEADIYKFVGCTLCLAMITDGEIICANSGDSRCILGVKGKAVEMSFDHKPELEKERTRIEKAKGYVEDNRVNGNLNLSRSLGDFEYKSDKSLKADEQLVISLPDIKVEKLSPDVDFMVIACDGIWEVLESQKVVDFVYSKLSKSVKISQIIDELFESIISPSTSITPLGCDNMTCVIVQFKK